VYDKYEIDLERKELAIYPDIIYNTACGLLKSAAHTSRGMM